MGHVMAVDALTNLDSFRIINLGTGYGTTVMELITEFEKVTGKKVPFITSSRRSGDVAKSLSDVALSKELLGFECKRTLKDMCRDAWHYRVNTKK
jgi:UDP-glucose 4-epimerase